MKNGEEQDEEHSGRVQQSSDGKKLNMCWELHVGYCHCNAVIEGREKVSWHQRGRLGLNGPRS